MKRYGFIFLSVVIIFAFGLIMSTGCTKQENEEPVKEPEAEESQAAKPEVELPAAVVEAIEANVPDAEIDSVEVENEAGIVLYDIEFKSDRGEIEVAEDGTVIDVVTIITTDAIEGATIKRLEKSEIRFEIKKEGEMGTLHKLDTPRYVYEAEIEKDGQTGEIEVDAEGNITEPLKWDTQGSHALL
jgi:uncharacterized membrane protein YkoI